MAVSGLNNNDDWQFGRGKSTYLNGSDEVGQKVVTRLRSFARDWYLDVDANIDWIKLLGTRGVRVSTIRQQIERVILETEGVAKIDALSLDFDRSTRRLIIDANVKDVFGELLPITEVTI